MEDTKLIPIQINNDKTFTWLDFLQDGNFVIPDNNPSQEELELACFNLICTIYRGFICQQPIELLSEVNTGNCLYLAGLNPKRRSEVVGILFYAVINRYLDLSHQPAYVISRLIERVGTTIIPKVMRQQGKTYINPCLKYICLTTPVATLTNALTATIIKK